VGIAHLIPADLRGLPRALERGVEDELASIGLTVGPSPYPPVSPWAVSVRFLAARWFAWLGRTQVIPVPTAVHLARLAWVDEQNPEVDEVVAGRITEPPGLEGVRALAQLIGGWNHDGARLGDDFRRDGTFTLVVELRIDHVDRSAALGQAVARAITGFLS
jgi:hypothetical protein